MSQIVTFVGPTSSTDNQLRTQISTRSAAYDPVDKLRVSQPQALIDTDFEYGTQPTKWESIGLQNNRQSCYYIPQSPLTISGITGLNTLNGGFTLAGTFTLSTGDIIFVQNSLNNDCNGWLYVSAGGTNTSTVRTAVGTTIPATNFFNAAGTYVYRGIFYSNCGIALTGTSAVTFSGTTITVTTTSAHGLNANSFIYVVNLGGGTPAPNGAFVVATVPTANTFTYVVPTAPTVAITNTAGQVNIFARPSGFVESRPFDGGVAFSAGSIVPNQQLIRQTRRYFRYQSGKGLQFSTGSTLKPNLFNPSLAASGTAIGSTVTVTCQLPHNLATGAVVLVADVDQTGYNGTYTITRTSAVAFTYVARNVLQATTATGIYIKISPFSWWGSSNRIGMFDQQNGLFFEFDGQTLYAVLRSSTTQLNGRVTVTQGSAAVTGTGTQFSTQLKPYDYIVIRGQSYKVVTITSDTAMLITPEYRGATLTQGGAIVSKTIDTRIPQSQWFDVCDGTSSINNPSGYLLDLTRMQMWYIDYSWYGAGAVRFGFRAKDGAVTYVHQIQNNNVKFEAYMRSGNMASHYESNTQSPAAFLTSTLTSATTTLMNVSETTFFAPAGLVKLQASGGTGGIEYISYTGKTATTLTGLTRAQVGGGAAQTFTFSATAPISVEFVSPDSAAALSHWGSSVIMDGQFNDDKSLIFNYGTTTAISTSSTSPIVIMAIRVAPSVDNGTTGTLGLKETINRMQLQLDSLGLYTTGTGYLINLIINGFASGAMSGGFIAPIQQVNGITSSLAQIAINTNAVTVTGGESVFAAYSNTSGNTTLDLSIVRDLGNSILGGGTSNTVPTTQAGFYPDGPDILYIVATPLSATTSTILARLSWKEAQA
jgi:hypothetical protein